MRFRFSIRGLLWLTLTMAISMGWWINRGHLSSQLSEQAAVSWQEKANLQGTINGLEGERKRLFLSGILKP